MNFWLSERQAECILHLNNALHRYKGGIVWWKIGEGKTRIAIALLVGYIQEGDRALVVCSPKAFRQWKDEIRESPHPELLTYVNFLSYGQLKNFKDFSQVNEFIQQHKFRFVVFDELWLYKNPNSSRSRSAGWISKTCKSIGLSGSLVTARNIEDIFGQCKAVGIEGILAKNLTHFRSQFTVAVQSYGLEFWAKRNAIPTIKARLAPAVDIYFPKDQRETKLTYVNVDPTNEQQFHFNELRENYFTRIQTQALEIKYATTLLAKLQQLSDGFYYVAKGETIFIRSSKLDRLCELLEEFIDAGEQVLVWFAFKASLDVVYKKYHKKATALSSSHEFDAGGWKAKKYAIALATIGSGASLNDFAHVQQSIIYSCSFNPLQLQQAMGRTNRKSSLHNVCHYRFLNTVDSVDSYIYQSALASGKIEASIKTVLEKYMHKTQIENNIE